MAKKKVAEKKVANKKVAKKKATKKKHTKPRKQKSQGRCVVLMPFSTKFRNQWGLAVKPAIEAAGLEAFRADEGPVTGNVMENVASSIFGAELLIADVTSSNPNVLYELGLAQAIGKRVVMVCQNIKKVPRDVQSHRFLEYDPDDIERFRIDLEVTISEALALGSLKKQEYVFPDLELMDATNQRELRYFRKKAQTVKITAYPPTTDLFFNDQLLGTQPQIIRVNKDQRNTISASNVMYFEEHRQLTENDLEKKHIHLILEGLPKPRTKARDKIEASKASGYIRWKGKSPANPALMRAVSHYLLHIKAYKEAQEEADELVKSAPEWYLAHNQAGHVATREGNLDSALTAFQLVRLLRPDSVIGYYNLACVYSLRKDSRLCLYYLRQIITDPLVLATYDYFPFDIMAEDGDFANIIKDREHNKEFQSIACELRSHWNSFKANRDDKVTPQKAKNGTTAVHMGAPPPVVAGI